MTDEWYPRLRALLHPDRRSSGARGLALSAGVPELNLLKGDRLEPSAELPITARFFSQRRPFVASFWRRSQETWARRRNPLFSQETGVTPAGTMTIDWLHALSLGVFKFWTTRALHALFDANAFRALGGRPAIIAQSVAAIRSGIFDWYTLESRRGREHTRLQDLTSGMVGETKDDALGLHGAETNGFMHYTLTLLDEHAACMDPALVANLRSAGTSLCEILDLCRRMENPLDRRDVEHFINAVRAHVRLLPVLDIHFRPKHHMMMELAANLLHFGAPQEYGCWLDESLNHAVQGIGRAAHRMVWHSRVLSGWRQAQDVAKRRRRV